MLVEKLLVQERQLDGVADSLDLVAQAADQVVVDIRYLFQHQLFHVQLRNPLVREMHPTIDQQRISGAQMLIMKPIGEADDAFLIPVADDQRAITVLEHLLEQYDFADLIELEDLHYVHRLVDHDLLARGQCFKINIRTHADPHLAAGRVDVRGIVLMPGEENCEGRWGLGEPVDLALQGHDLITRFTQRRRETLIVGSGSSRIRPSISQPTLQHGDVMGMGSDPIPEPIELVFERTNLSYQGFAVLIRPAITNRSGHDTPPVKTLPGQVVRSRVIIPVRAGRWATFA